MRCDVMGRRRGDRRTAVDGGEREDIHTTTKQSKTKHVALHLSKGERSFASAGTETLPPRLREARSEEGSFAVHLRLRLPPKTCDTIPKDITTTKIAVCPVNRPDAHRKIGGKSPHNKNKKKFSSIYLFAFFLMHRTLAHPEKGYTTAVIGSQSVIPLFLSPERKFALLFLSRTFVLHAHSKCNIFPMLPTKVHARLVSLHQYKTQRNIIILEKI